MSEKVMRCRQELSAAIRKALQNPRHLTPSLPPIKGPTKHPYTQLRDPSLISPPEKNAKKMATPNLDEERDKKGHIGNMTSSKENNLLFTDDQASPPIKKSRDKSEELPTDLFQTDSCRDLMEAIDHSSPSLIQELSQSPCWDMNIDSFVRVILNDKEPAISVIPDLEAMMVDAAGDMVEAVLEMKDDHTKPKSYFIL